MNNLNDTPRGFTGCLTKAGLKLGDGAKTGYAWAAPNGAGIDFAIDGIAYHLADSATNVPLTVGTTIPALSICPFLVQVDAAGTTTTVQGEIILVADITAGRKVIQWPFPADGKAPIGAILIQTGAATTFIPGTTALDAANITDTYLDFVFVPVNPRTTV